MLKPIITYKTKNIIFGTLAAYALIFYLLTNQIHFFSPHYLPLTKIDYYISMNSFMLWVYLSMYPMMYLAFINIKKIRTLNNAFYSFFMMETVAFIIFLIYPTVYPRELFLIPDNITGISRTAFMYLRFADTPANCCPSLHVANCFICTFYLYNESLKKFFFFLAWSILIAISTMATKQHYIWDVLAGITLAIVHYWLFFYKIKSGRNNFQELP